MFQLFLFFVVSLISTEAKNTLLIVADDGGLEAGVFGNPVIQTPNLDELGRRSARFKNSFTSVSSCSPSRSVILTGLPGHQNGMYGLHQGVHHFNSFSYINDSLPNTLTKANVLTGIIGKKHVGPKSSYKFDFEYTEEQESLMQVGRNITRINLLVKQFLKLSQERRQNFFLYVAFHDPHRCGHSNPKFGNFCEKFGDGLDGREAIPDWKPVYYDPKEVVVPYFIQDTPAARRDIANQYTTISRLDQGIGLILDELEKGGFLNDTLVIFTSDNGIPFPAGRTNFYEPGILMPFLISSPLNPETWGHVYEVPISHVDLFPTILQWQNVSMPAASNGISWTGKSILPFFDGSDEDRAVFGSHSFHEVTMAYPMRFVRTKRYKLIHNINYWIPFPIDQDFYISPTFQDILHRSVNNETLPWYKTLETYYMRPEWEFYDLKIDPLEQFNGAQKPSYQGIFTIMKEYLQNWQNITQDPWICSPHSVLEDLKTFHSGPSCMPLYN